MGYTEVTEHFMPALLFKTFHLSPLVDLKGLQQCVVDEKEGWIGEVTDKERNLSYDIFITPKEK